jgi:hypothetical protein
MLNRRFVAVVLVLLVIVTAAIGLAYQFWDVLTRCESTSAILRNLSLALGVPIGIVLALWRSTIANRQASAAHKQVATGLEQTRLAQESLLTDRFQRAAEMLGHESPVVRIGGVQALTLLAGQHMDAYYHPVWQLLTTFAEVPRDDWESSSGSDVQVASDALRWLEEIRRGERQVTDMMDLVPDHNSDSDGEGNGTIVGTGTTSPPR